MKKKFESTIGWLGAIIAIIMFLSYIDQIGLNLQGHYGSILVPAMLVVNCFVWMLYGLLKETKDWPMIVANGVGKFFGILTVITGIYSKYHMMTK